MYPALHDGDSVIVFRCWPKRYLRKGQIVVCNPTTVDSQISFIKRIVGLPNENITIQLTRAEQMAMPLPILLKEYEPPGRRVWHIPLAHCFVQGDSLGSDSKQWGPIPLQDIEGLVILKLRPYRQTASKEKNKRQ